MNKKLILILLSCFTALLLTSCGSKLTLEEKKADNIQSEQDEKNNTISNEELKESSKTDNNSESSNGVHTFKSSEDFWVIVNGKKYILPTDDLSLFEGWTSDSLNEELESYSYGIGATYKKDNYTTVSVLPLNDSEETKKLSDCKIASISIFSLADFDTMEIELPNGIKMGSTYEDVLKAFGTPTEDSIISEENESPSLRIMEYSLDILQYVRLGLTDNIVDTIDIEFIP